MSTDTPHYAGHRARLRERLLKDSTALADYEILELLLGYALLRRDTKPLAKELLSRFGSIRGVLDALPAEMQQVDGVGEGVAALRLLLREMMARYAEAPMRERKVLCTSFYFTSVRCISALCFRIISTMYSSNCSIIQCLETCACNKICIHKTNFRTKEKSFVFLWRIDHKVFSFNIKFLSKWNLSATKGFIFHIVRSIQIFHLSFRIIVNDQFDRIKDCHIARSL